jgi:hypothetical protein
VLHVLSNIFDFDFDRGSWSPERRADFEAMSREIQQRRDAHNERFAAEMAADRARLDGAADADGEPDLHGKPMQALIDNIPEAIRAALTRVGAERISDAARSIERLTQARVNLPGALQAEVDRAIGRLLAEIAPAPAAV